MAIYQNINGTIKEVADIYENVDGTIKQISARYQNVDAVIKQTYGARLMLSNPSLNYSIYYLGQEYVPRIYCLFSTEQIAKIVSLYNSGYIYYRFYYVNNHYYIGATTEHTSSISTLNSVAKMWTYSSSGYGLAKSSGTNMSVYAELISNFNSMYFYKAYVGARTKTNWIKITNANVNRNTIWLNLVCTTLSWTLSSAQPAKALEKLKAIYTQYFASADNSFVLEFSKTGTEA